MRKWLRHYKVSQVGILYACKVFVDNEPICELDQKVRPFVLEKRGGTLVMLSPEELRQRWEDHKCQASDRIVDQRTGKQFPAVALGILAELEKHSHVMSAFQ